MRVIAVVCVFVILGIIRGVEGSNISFNVNGATNATYTEFIKTLRDQLIDGTKSSSYGIPVLPQSVSDDSQRFILVDLINNIGPDVTVAIDVVSAHIVAYRVGVRSYFLRQDDPTVPIKTLFHDTTRETLAFTVSYTDLEKAANLRRGQIYLGPLNLNIAIQMLVLTSDSRLVSNSLIIIIQMVSEAVRFRYIETQVGFTMGGGVSSYLPGHAVLSLEDNWSVLSTELQRTLKGGIFTQSVELRSTNHRLVIVDSVASPVISGIALLLYQCSTKNSISTGALKPSSAGIIKIRMYVDDQCVVHDRTTRISGRNGLCVDVRDGKDHNGNPIQLWPCGQESNQQWTFRKDGTIRSMGKCMTADGFSPADHVMIFDCATAEKDATKWVLSTDGTITNPRSGLVITAPRGQSSDVKGTKLTVTNNTHATTQGWRAGDDVEPTVSNIIGFNRMCIQANSDNSRVWMENCLFYGGEPQQRWALYGDGSIRVDGDRSLCLTSNGHSSNDVIIIKKCEGVGNQRWVFRTDGTILNPNAGLVMDVKESDVSLRQIILYQPTDNPNQQWLPTF